MITFKTYNKQELYNFINSEEYKNLEVLPISYHRAVSHINNPRAHDNDILLIIAHEGNNLLGYLGILPDDLYLSKDTIIHLGWLSCIWVSPLTRGKGIAKNLVITAYEAYKKHIIITNFTKEAAALYNKLNIFTDLPSKKGIRYYRRMCLSKILPYRYPKVKNLTFLFKVFDFGFNLFWYPDLLKKKKIFNIDKISPEQIIYENYFAENGFRRSTAEIKWILSFPWIKKTNKISNEAKRYHFSSEEYQFESDLISINTEKQHVGSLFYTLRNGHLKIPYIFCMPENYKLMAQFIDFFAFKTNAFYITIFEKPEIVENVSFSKIYKKQIYRNFKISTHLLDKIKLITNPNEIYIHDGDGDAIFT